MAHASQVRSPEPFEAVEAHQKVARICETLAGDTQLSGWLGLCGYRPRPGAGSSALIVLRHSPPDHNALGEVLALCAAPGPPILVLDVAGQPIDRIIAMEAGCDLILPWPCEAREFIASVRGVERRRFRVAPVVSPIAPGLVYAARHRRLCAPDGRSASLTANEHKLLLR